MELLAEGLIDRVHDAQLQFRDLLEAMSRPGVVMALRGNLPTPPPPLAPATYALLLGLADHETTFWLDGEHPQAIESLRFHTGARLVRDPSCADFAVLDRSCGLESLGIFRQGEPAYPDRSSTVFLQVASLGSGQALRLRGAGIDGEAYLRVEGLHDRFVALWDANRRRFPLGVDLILVADDAVGCLPRTVSVEG